MIIFKSNITTLAGEGMICRKGFYLESESLSSCPGSATYQVHDLEQVI